MQVRHRTCVAIAAGAIAFLGQNVEAQTGGEAVGPRSGTWGAEVSYGGFTSSSLLYLSSPRAAWLLGASILIDQETGDGLGFGDPFGSPGPVRATNTFSSIQLRAGRRWWSGESNVRVRPLWGAGLTGRYVSYPNTRVVEGGVYGELGATYFFSPHVSLGAVGELGLARGQDRRTNRGAADLVSDHWYVRGDLVRVIAAVYF